MDKLMELIVLHPRLFRGSPPVVPSHLPAGWFSLVDALCLDIEALLGPEPQRFEVAQIKEKFGALRFYFSVDAKEDVFIDVQSPEGVQTLVQCADGPAVMVQVRALVNEVSLRSTETCQDCGAHGIRANRNGWLSVLCEQHAAQRLC